MTTNPHPPTFDPAALLATCVANLQEVLSAAGDLRVKQAGLLRAGHAPRQAAILLEGGHLQEHLMSRTLAEAEASVAVIASLTTEVATLPLDHPVIVATGRHVAEHGQYRPGVHWRWAIRTDFQTNLCRDRLCTLADVMQREFGRRSSPTSSDGLQAMAEMAERLLALGSELASASSEGPKGIR